MKVADVMALRKSLAADDSIHVIGHVKAVKTDIHGVETVVADDYNLLTVNGRDWLIQQLYTNSTAGTRGANYLALSTDADAAAASERTLDNEITGSGLARVDVASSGTITHATGTNTVTISHTFRASAAVANIRKAGLFEASNSVLPRHLFSFASPTSLGVNEQLSVIWTVTIA